jgi:hypothetical protein
MLNLSHLSILSLRFLSYLSFASPPCATPPMTFP